PLEQIHSGLDYRSRVTPQYLPIRASTPGKSVCRTYEILDLTVRPSRVSFRSLKAYPAMLRIDVNDKKERPMQPCRNSRIVSIEADASRAEARQCHCKDPGSLSVGRECECATNRAVGSPAAGICFRETGL